MSSSWSRSGLKNPSGSLAGWRIRPTVKASSCMKPPDQTRRELTRQWLTKAEEDYQAAKLLLAEYARFRFIIAFHAQQAAEKFLKAVFVNYGIAFARTHDLKALLDLLNRTKPALALSLRHVEFLTPFGVDARYPGDLPEVSEPEAASAVKAAGDVRKAVRKLLRPLVSSRTARRRR